MMFMEGKDEPHIILVAPVAPPIGGITQWTSLVTNELQTQGIAHSIVNTSPRRRRLDGQSKIERIAGGFQSTIAAAKQLVRYARSNPPTAVHISSSGSLSLVRDAVMVLIAKPMRTRTLLHLHHGRLPKILHHRSFERAALDFLASLVDSMVVLDRDSAVAATSRWKNLSIEVIANPVATQSRDLAHATPNGKNVLYLGWVVPNKGIEDLLQVWMDLAPAFPDWRLTLVGGVSEEYGSYLTDTYNAERWKITGEVSHNQAMETLATSDILVLPSYSEGFPNVVLEAMSFGKAVVATEVGGIPEMLSQGEGILVAPGVQEELRKALSNIMSDDTYRTETGRKGLDRVDREYKTSRVVTAYRRLWEGGKG